MYIIFSEIDSVICVIAYKFVTEEAIRLFRAFYLINLYIYLREAFNSIVISFFKILLPVI